MRPTRPSDRPRTLIMQTQARLPHRFDCWWPQAKRATTFGRCDRQARSTIATRRTAHSSAERPAERHRLCARGRTADKTLAGVTATA